MEKDNPKIKTIALQLTALSVVLLLLVTTIQTTLAAETDNYSLVEKSSALQDVNIEQVIKLDRNDIYQKAIGGQRFDFDLNGKQVSFALQERNLIDEDFKVIGPDGEEDVERTTSIKNTHVYLGQDIDGAQYVSAVISRGSMYFSIDVGGKTYSIAPYDGTGASGLYAVYTSEDRSIQPSTGSDGLVLNEPNKGELEIASESQNQSGEQATIQDLETISDDSSATMVMSSYSNENTYIYGNLYVACDADFQSTYGSSWSNVAFTTQAYVALRYETQLGICLNLVAINGLPSNVCTSTDGPTLWGQFKDWTKQSVNRWDRDVAHLFTTKTLNNGVTDVSYETGAALDRYSGSSYDGFACSVSRHLPAWTWEKNAWYLGHDLGHLLNADHDFAQWIDGKGTWCYPSYAPSDMVFSDGNKQRIVSWAQEAFSYQRLVNAGPSVTDSNGIQASYTSVKTDSVAEVDREAVVKYSLKNTGSTSKTVMAFTAVRDAFGAYHNFSFQSLTIGPQQTITYQTWFHPQSGGEWTIYPAYIYSGQTKSFNDVAVHPTIYYELNSWQGKFTSSDMALFCRWGLYSTVRYPGPGQTIMADFTLFNTASGTGSTTYNSIFVEARDPNDVCKDFGAINNPSLTQKGGYGVVGGGYHGVAFRTVDVTGVWKIAPCYQTSDGWYGPWMAPLNVNIGFISIKYMDLLVPHTWDQDTTYVLSTWTSAATYGDPSVSFIKVGLSVAIHTFTSVTGRPSMEIAIATFYHDPYTPYGGPYNIYNNQAEDVSTYINKSTFNSGTYGTNYGYPYLDGVDPKTKSGVDILDGQQETYSYGYGMAYPTYTNPDPYIYAGDIAMVAVGALVTGWAGIAINVGWLCSSALVQSMSTQQDNPHDVGFTSGGDSAYAHWDRANLPYHDPYGYDRFYWTYENNVSTINYAFLEIADNEGDDGWDNVGNAKFCFQIQCMYKYGYEGGFNGYQNSRFATTQPLYICIEP